MDKITSVRKVAFIGTSPSSRHLAPFDKPDWEVWGCGPAFQDEGKPTMPGFPPMRWDRWFELHPMSDNDPEYGSVQDPGYWEWLVHQNVNPVYYRPPLYKNLPGREFPWDEILEEHGGYFLDSTPNWMMAFAYDYFPDITDVGLYGIDFSSAPERQTQKKGCYHFIRLFKLRGIKVHIPHESDMAFEPLPYPEEDPLQKKLNSDKQYLSAKLFEIVSRKNSLHNSMIAQEAEELKISGALSEIEHLLGNRTREIP